MAGIPERTAQTSTYNQMLARVAPKYLKGVHDQVFNDAAAWRAFTARVPKAGGGFADLKWNVDLGTGTGESSYKDLDVINTHRHDTETLAFVDTKEYAEQYAVSFRERDKHRGDLAVVTAAAASMAKAKKRIIDALDTHLILDGTGNSSKRILGFAQWLDSDPTSDTVAGINRANVSAWRNQFLNNANDASDILLDLRELYSECRSGGKRPNLILGNEMFVRALEGQYTSDINHNLPSGGEGVGHSGDGALTAVFYKGVPVIACENWTQYGTATGGGQCVLLNTDTWRIIDANAKSGADYIEMIPEQRAPAQTAVVGHLRFHGEVICLEPRRNGVLFNVGDDVG